MQNKTNEKRIKIEEEVREEKLKPNALLDDRNRPNMTDRTNKSDKPNENQQDI